MRKSRTRGVPIRQTPEQLLLSQVATRLVQLLKVSQNPEGDREEAVAMLKDKDLYQGTVRPELSPTDFAWVLIEDNHLLQESVWALKNTFNPMASETVVDLIGNLIPAD